MVRVVWTRDALTNLRLIRHYIEQFDPQAAQRIAARLIEAGDSPRDFPDRGRPATGRTRELVTVRPYVLRYRMDGGTVYILRVRHSAQAPD